MEETRWCYACGEIKPLDSKHFAWHDKKHTRFRNKCRECTNFDSRMSHAKERARKKDLKERSRYGKRLIRRNLETNQKL